MGSARFGPEGFVSLLAEAGVLIVNGGSLVGSGGGLIFSAELVGGLSGSGFGEVSAGAGEVLAGGDALPGAGLATEESKTTILPAGPFFTGGAGEGVGGGVFSGAGTLSGIILGAQVSAQDGKRQVSRPACRQQLVGGMNSVDRPGQG